MSIVSGIIALLKAIPYLDAWFKNLALAYNKWKVESFDKEFTKGMAELIAKHDQRSLEAALGMQEGPSNDQTDVVTRPRRNRED